MYLKEKWIRFLKVKNVVLIMAGVFFLLVSVNYFATMLLQYWGDWFTIRRAKGMPGAIVDFFLGILMVVCSRISRNLVNDAMFFSRYFEGDLSGYIEFEELAQITGRSAARVRRRLKLLRRLYMTRFQFAKPVVSGTRDRVELPSKTVTCTCRSCGGELEKRAYFTGECPWCGSSDLTARVVSGAHFFWIYDDEARRVNDPGYYQGGRLTLRRSLLAIGLSLAMLTLFLCVVMVLDDLSKYNDPEYLKKMLFADNHLSTYELIHRKLRRDIEFNIAVFTAVFPAVPILTARARGIVNAIRYSGFFARIPSPYVAVSELSKIRGREPQRELRSIVLALREGYLKGCAPEKHGGPLRIGLAKQIVKDRCPNCGSPITGAVDESYTCKYCGSQIMNVIRKH